MEEVSAPATPGISVNQMRGARLLRLLLILQPFPSLTGLACL